MVWNVFMLIVKLPFMGNLLTFMNKSIDLNLYTLVFQIKTALMDI